ncbi:aminotransferase, partial [Campylobacter jejuni]|nr:aminotransferase [Campylobacter jejuni]
NFLVNLGLIKEKALFKQDLFEAENIYCINSVRGLKKVKLQ